MNMHVSHKNFIQQSAAGAAFLIILAGCIFPHKTYASTVMVEDECFVQEQEADEQVLSVEEIPSDEGSDDLEPAVEGTDWREYFIIDGTTITGLQNGGESLSEIVIPDELGITAIGPDAFKCGKFSSITLPSTLRVIGSGAFCECSGLQSITIPANVTDIKNSAFENCSSLSDVDIRTKSIKSAGQWIFKGCKIHNLTLPDGMTEIPAKLFHMASFDNCDIVIPKSVKAVKEMAFCAIKGINSLSFEEGSCLTDIEANAFKDYPLPTIVLPNSLKAIGNAAFYGSVLTEITIPQNVEIIGTTAFEQFTHRDEEKIAKVTLNSSKIRDIDFRECVFYGCRISELIIADGVTNIPVSLFANAGFHDCDIVFPSSVKDIKKSAFSSASGITSVSFAPGSKLEKIGDSAFENAEFTEITFPDGLKSIGASAFRWSHLNDITIPKSVSKIGNLAFSNLINQTSARFRVINGSFAFKWLKNNGFSDNIVTVCTITYKLDKGTNSPANKSTYTTGDVMVLSDPSRAGFDFDGWYSDAKFRNPTTGIQATDSGNKTFYAKWTAIQYNISYVGADIATIKNPPTTYTTLKTVALKPPKKDGYKFQYWTDADGNKATTIKKGTVGDLTFTALWKPVDYTIAYNLKGGKLDKTAVRKYNIESDIELPIPTRAGYTFDGWYSNSRFDGEPVTHIEPGNTGKQTFFAKWTKD